MSTTILLAYSLQSIFSASANAAVTASGPSPPPDAYSVDKFLCTALMSLEKPKFFVTYVWSCGGWSRKATRPTRRSSMACSLPDSKMCAQMASMFFVADEMYVPWLPVQSWIKTRSLWGPRYVRSGVPLRGCMGE